MKFLKRIRGFINRLVLGKQLVALDRECKLKSHERRADLTKQVEALERRANKACSDAGLVTNSEHA